VAARTKRLRPVALLAAALLTACGGNETQSSPPPPSPIPQAFSVDQARRLVPLARAASTAVFLEDGCTARRAVRRLRADARRVQLAGHVARVARLLRCPDEENSVGASRATDALEERIGTLAREALADEKDLRIAPSALRTVAAEDKPHVALSLLYLFGDPPLAEATRGQRAAYALEALEGEVNNGGFEQFFWNTGDLYDEALVGAKLVGAKEYAALLESAAAVFPNGTVPEDLDEVQTLVDGFSDRDLAALSRLDDRFYELDSATPLLASYLAEHPEEFVVD
jgi:hypothetical protein